jgi:choloylglycine hydrolase
MQWIVALFLRLLLPQFAHACTAFQLKAQDDSLIYCRTLEFGFTLDSNLLIVPRGIQYVGTAPEGEGLKWKTKYGFVGMNQSIERTMVSDGMNEKGLVVGALYLPGFCQYETPDPARSDRTIGGWELPVFLLSSCATIAEVKAILPTILVAQEPKPSLGSFVLPLHFYVGDASGEVLIVEYVNGERMLHDDPLGVLTNSPPFDWHLNNLSNYINLSPVNTPELQLSGWTVKRLGEGNGLLGLPGDFTPPSRFVRATLYSQWAAPTKNANEAVAMGFHILNTFDIFSGIIRSHPTETNPFKDAKVSFKTNPEVTEWIVVHDQSNLRTYFRTYQGQRIQMVDVKKIDFSREGLRQILLAKEFLVEDINGNSKPLKDVR